MAVIVYTDNPRRLLNAVYEEINDYEIETWKCDKDGDLTHTSSQWKYLAWMRPRIRKSKIIFNIVEGDDIVSRRIYGIYHGRLIEMLLTYFDTEIERLHATPLPTSGDIL